VRFWIVILAAAGILIARAASPDARLIALDVQVVDTHSGEIPELLGPEDFEVRNDGQKIPIRGLHIDTPPMDVVFLIYSSGRGLTTPRERKSYLSGLNAAVDTLRPQDRAGVVRGSGTRGVSLRLTADRGALKRSLLRGAQPDKGRLFDATSNALSLFPREPSLTRRRIVIAISDDIERHSETSADALEAALLDRGVTLHEVMLAFTPAGARIHPGAPRIGGLHLPIPRIAGIAGSDSDDALSLVGLVNATGGEHPIGDSFEDVLPALIRRLRLRYTLTVAVPAGPRAFHRIEVELTPQKRSKFPGLAVRTRVGYYSEP
jgi:hypothetical protein